jgi:hypothetical protein
VKANLITLQLQSIPSLFCLLSFKKAALFLTNLYNNFQAWINPMSGKIVVDGCSLLNEALKLMRPDDQTNIYAKLAKIKAIKPVDHGYNIVKWHSAMES